MSTYAPPTIPKTGETPDSAGPRHRERDESRDGLRNRAEAYVLSHFPKVWRALQAVPWVERKVNEYLIDNAVNKTKPRPYPLSTMSPYTSWRSLTDRIWSGRHLPPDPAFQRGLPPVESVVELFRRAPGRFKVSGKSTVLFSHFAQWFTDGFLRTDRRDPRKNTSNHDIDLSQLYGMKPDHGKFLRRFQEGKLKSQCIHGEEYPPFYFDAEGWIRPDFKKSESDMLRLLKPLDLPLHRTAHLFAMGTERANVHIGYVALNVLFLREHNRVCDVLRRRYPDWDDERLFQTARNIVIVLVIKIVIEEYINHITPFHFRFKAGAPAAGAKRWHRPNWMTVEFNLLYRWHPLTPDELLLDDRYLPTEDTIYNNALITERGLGPIFDSASRQPAGEISLFNTTQALLGTEDASIRLGRATELQGYNDYREVMAFPRVTRFEQISSDPEVVSALRGVYGDVDRIELYPGLFAEDVRPGAVLPALIGRMVGIDAFSQALTNPLLTENIYNEDTFSPVGLAIIEDTKTLSDVLHRNVPAGGNRYLVSMTRID